MASIQVRAKVVAFVGGAQRRPGDTFSIDEKEFNPDVFERLEPVKAEQPKAKQPKAPKAPEQNPQGNGGDADTLV